MSAPGFTHRFPVEDYDLAATLDCGQAFRWRADDTGWEGVVEGTWVRLTEEPGFIQARTSVPQTDWRWLEHYLQTTVVLSTVLDRFPDDAHLQAAVAAHRGLRLLRQSPWECLASFILSSTKQIVQIRQIIELLCERFGERLVGPDSGHWRYAFPAATRLAFATEAQLRGCKAGFRAPYLLGAARAVSQGECDLPSLARLPLEEARRALLALPGVGDKIAECVLLFAYGFEDAFPIDVWVARALRRHYFRGRSVSLTRLRSFAQRRWQGCGGFAQQYLFHHARTLGRGTLPAGRPRRRRAPASQPI